MGSFSSANPTPSSGAAYGVSALSGSDPEIVLPIGTSTDSWIIKAESANTGDVYLGWDDDVTTAIGMPLAPQESLSVEIDNSQQEVYAVSDNVGARVRYFAID